MQQQPTPDNANADEGDPYVVAIGASAGGLEALESLFKAMPTDLGVAFVVVQHLSPDFKSHMEQLLARQTAMPIFRVENGMEVLPNSIYLIPPKKEMIISKRRLLLTDRDPTKSLSHPIDQFFRSLANDVGRHSVGVILSGTGSDGSRGLRDIHEAGGLVLCQDEDSAGFDGMPLNAQETGAVDLVLPPEAMATALERYVSDSVSAETLAREHLGAPQLDGIEKLFDILRARFNLDFGNYKRTTIGRRVKRRMGIRQEGDFERYVELLSRDPEELDALYRDLLIGVTRFFRDEEAYEQFAGEVLAEFAERARREETIRGWVAGCATGEEAYSLAMLIHERLSQDGASPKIKIFATDAHASSLDTAAKGVYSDAAVDEIEPRLRDRYFERQGDMWHVSAELRRMIVFAQHNLIQDAPFTQLDFVSCRNLLIYLQPPAQKKALSFFHFALRTGGALWLGPSESMGDLADEFSTIDKRWKLYRKRRDVRLPAEVRADFSLQPARLPRAALGGKRPRGHGVDNQLLSTYDRLLDLKMPTSFLVDESAELVHTFGGAQRLLRSRGGRVSTNLLDLIDPALKTSVAAAIQQALRESTEVRYTGLSFETTAGEVEGLVMIVTPIIDPKTAVTNLLVEFEETGETPSPRTNEAIFSPQEVDVESLTREHVDSLETELRTTQENLQAVVEELETANEELQAANEELVASNEELQSTNEELHSVNEELYTVNAEHQRKIDELTRVTDDLDNLLASTEVGVVFLDRELKVRRFTPGIADTFRLLPQDIGRRIDTFASNLDYPGLMEDLERVLQTGDAVEHEVTCCKGRRHLLRVLPYKSLSVASGGVLLTLIDIENLRLAQGESVRNERRFRQLLDSVSEGVLGLDREGVCTFVNQSCLRILGAEDEQQLLGQSACRFLHASGPHGEPAEGGECGVCESLVSGELLHVENATFQTLGGDKLPVEYWSHPIKTNGEVSGVVLSFFDTSGRRNIEEQLRLNSRMLQLSHDAIIVWKLDDGILSWNRGAESLYGYSLKEVVGKATHELLQTKHTPNLSGVLKDLKRTGEWTGELEHVTKDGRRLRVSSRHQLVTNNDGAILVLEINRDITDKYRAEREVREARRIAESASMAKSTFLANMSHELRTPLTAILGFADILLAEADDAVSRERAATIRRNGAFLLDLLNDILDLSKIEAGKLTINPEPVDILALASEVVTLMRVRADAKDLTLGFELKTAVPRVTQTDPKRLRQILVNLIGNAIKFTDEGRVDVSLRVVSDGDGDEDSLAIEVRDTGPGISPEDLKRVFRPFEQANDLRGKAHGGTGLGLSISRLLAHELGGEIDADSEYGKGSRFSLVIPLVEVSADTVPAGVPDPDYEADGANVELEAGDALAGRRVLIADDRRDIRHVAQYFLERAGAEVVAAEDGQQAYDLILDERAQSRDVDLVIMDMQMPVLDGYETTRRLVQAGFDRPIIALTASAMKGERERTLTAGCVAYLTKPIDGKKLVDVCLACLRVETPGV